MIDFYLSHQLTQTKKQRKNTFLKKNKKIQKNFSKPVDRVLNRYYNIISNQEIRLLTKYERNC